MWKGKEGSPTRSAFLQISRLGASAPSLGADSAAVLLVHLLLPDQAMKSNMMMPLSPILTANCDTVSIVVFRKNPELLLSGKKCSTRQH